MGREPHGGRHPKIASRLARDDRERRRLEVARSWGVAPPVYDGAPIIHRHYNADGELVGHTEIVSPWDDDARAEAEALWEADRLVCSVCGNLREDCSDPTKPWHEQRHICYASRAQAWADRMYGEKHKDRPFHDGNDRGWSDKATLRAPYHFRDGVRVWVSQYDLTPDDTFI